VRHVALLLATTSLPDWFGNSLPNCGAAPMAEVAIPVHRVVDILLGEEYRLADSVSGINPAATHDQIVLESIRTGLNLPFHYCREKSSMTLSLTQSGPKSGSAWPEANSLCKNQKKRMLLDELAKAKKALLNCRGR
jgi:hypothetical protein